MLTQTHDSPTRAAAAGHPNGPAYFSYPAGVIYAAPVFYARRDGAAAFDDTNVHFEDGTWLHGFQNAGVIALMESAIANGRDYLWGVLKHEIQMPPTTTAAPISRATRRSFGLLARQRRVQRPLSTRRVMHKGHEWNERHWVIFDHLYNDPDYGT